MSVWDLPGLAAAPAMVFRAISLDMKECALALVSEGKSPAEVSGLLGMSERSIERWNDNLLYDHGSIVPPPAATRGRPTCFTPAIMEDLRQVLQDDPTLYLDELQEWLAMTHGIPISISALHDHLKEARLTRKLLRKVACERNEDARAEFRLAQATWLTAEMIVAVDETSKDNRTIYRHYGRAPAGERAISREPFARGQRYSILPALTVDGYIAAHIVPGSVDGETFLRFIEEEVVRAA